MELEKEMDAQKLEVLLTTHRGLRLTFCSATVLQSGGSSWGEELVSTSRSTLIARRKQPLSCSGCTNTNCSCTLGVAWADGLGASAGRGGRQGRRRATERRRSASKDSRAGNTCPTNAPLGQFQLRVWPFCSKVTETSFLASRFQCPSRTHHGGFRSTPTKPPTERAWPPPATQQGEEDRKRTQEAINTVLAHLAGAAVGLMADPR